MPPEQKIDLLRHQGQWKELLEAAPKLRKKLPTGSALDTIITAEAEFNLLLDSLAPFPHDLELLPENAEGFSSPQFLDRSLVSAIEATLDPVVNTADESWRFQAMIIKARVDLACGDLAKCIQKLEAISVPASYPRSVSGDQASADYKNLMPSIYLSTLGNAHKWARNFEKALSYFQQAVASLPQPYNVITAPSERLGWAEEALYGVASVSILLGRDTGDSIENYLKFMSSFPIAFRSSRRAAVLRFKISELIQSSVTFSPNLSISSTSFASTNLPNALSGIPKFSKLPVAKSVHHHVVTTLFSYLETYEKLVVEILPFPRGEDITKVDKMRHERVKEAYDWWTLYELLSSADDSPANVIERHCRFIETLYRGTKHTFQSLKLLRYLGHTFLSFLLHARDSVSTSERKEALSVVKSYAYLFEKRLGETLELERKKMHELRSKSKHVGNVTDTAEDSDYSFNMPPCLIDGESIGDAIGVLIAGSKTAMLCAYGDTETLKDAVKYAELGVSLVRNHGSWLKAEDIGPAAQRALQNLGISYGEMAQEVLTSEERRQCQALAIQALKDSRLAVQSPDSTEDGSTLLEPDLSDLDYQIALQLAEIGEISDAIESVKRSITSNPSHCASWNLLALLLTSRKDFLNALQVCDAGWKETLASKLRSRSSAENDEEIQFSWDSIDSETKEEMLNLSNGGESEMPVNGSLYRQSFDITSEGRQTPSINSGVLGSIAPRPHSRGSTGGSSVNPSQFAPYSFRVYNLQINIWLIASSLYRIWGKLDEAKSAVEQAETLADSLVRIESRIRESPSRIFLNEPPMAFSSPALKKSRAVKKPFMPPVKDGSVQWAFVEVGLRRVIADILFETFMIKDARHRITSKSSTQARHAKYLPENFTEKDGKKTRKTDGNVTLPFGRSARRLSTITVAKSIVSAMSNLGTASTDGTPDMSATNVSLNATYTKPTSSGPIASLINDFLLVTNVDDHHMAARVHLARLYKESGDLSLSEYWFERACKRSKARGASGGSLGICSIYGGLTSHWGWESWAGLGQLLKETSRFDQARDCLFFAIKLER
ncbi:hypothetical protein HDU67_007380, partial [Dinochytrium kinnereticum]